MVDVPTPSGDGAAREPGSDADLDEEAADEHRADGCNDARDDELTRKLAALAARKDPVPRKVVDAARAALRRSRAPGDAPARGDQ